MSLSRKLRLLAGAGLITGLIVVGYLTLDLWYAGGPPDTVGAPAAPPEGGRKKVILTDEAIKNLGLTSEPIKAQTHWKSIQVPGMVVDRPGQSDRNIITPVTGVVAKVSYFPGDTVKVGDSLFTIKVLSESMHLTQTDLFKVTQDTKLAEAERQRLEAASSSGAVSAATLIAVEEKITRLKISVKAYRQELLSRGLAPKQIDKVAEGDFVGEIPIALPPGRADLGPTAFPFEVQELKVELGQQVQAGQTLAIIANHQSLAIEGRAFPDETSLLQRSVKAGWPVEVNFLEDAAAGWPAINQEAFRIQYLANTIDPVNRTFAFLIPLENQSQVIKHDGRTQMLWRFRPGQKVRLHVRVEKLDNVFVVPADAVARDGPEAFVFTQNVNTFERKAVRVLLKDRQHVIIANDGALVPGSFIVQSAAAQLNRMVKSSANDVPKGYHIHADGTLHKNEGEGHK